MDTGHFNCRDYHVLPHFSATTIVSESYPLQRHESFQELERRSRSPMKPSFPLLKLPLELRQQILTYVLPHTQEFKDSGRLTEHARNFSAVKKRGAKGMVIPSSKPTTNTTVALSNVVWQRGNINILSTCRQLHDECTELIYGNNTFLLFLTYAGIQWRFRWLLPSGLAPSRSYQFLELVPQRYMRLIRKVIVNIDHVDSYTSMIKFNVGAKGLVHGLTRQVQRLVVALRSADRESEEDGKRSDSGLAKVHVLLKSDTAPQRTAANLLGCLVETRLEKERLQCGQSNSELHRRAAETSDDLEKILEPFSCLRRVREATVGGAVTDQFATNLQNLMRSHEPVDEKLMSKVLDEGMSASNNTGGVQLCVYGNDL